MGNKQTKNKQTNKDTQWMSEGTHVHCHPLTFQHLFQLRQHPFLPRLPSQATSSHPSIYTLPPKIICFILHQTMWNVWDLKKKFAGHSVGQRRSSKDRWVNGFPVEQAVQSIANTNTNLPKQTREYKYNIPNTKHRKYKYKYSKYNIRNLTEPRPNRPHINSNGASLKAVSVVVNLSKSNLI